MSKNIFPELNPGIWAKLNFNEESKSTEQDLTNPKICAEFVDSLHKARGINYSYGGFLEDRSHIWRNHYNKINSAFVHLGIDYNVPEGTKIAIPIEGKVVHIMKDNDQNGGWGGRILFELPSQIYLIYGHLKKDIKLEVGRVCKAGDIAGIIGSSNENGGWYPHLHVQLTDKLFIETYSQDLESIDGYLPRESPLLKHIICPEKIISV